MKISLYETVSISSYYIMFYWLIEPNICILLLQSLQSLKWKTRNENEQFSPAKPETVNQHSSGASFLDG